MAGSKLLVVQPQMADGKTPDGFPQVAVDGIGAGAGDQVMITSDGRGARELLQAAGYCGGQRHLQRQTQIERCQAGRAEGFFGKV